MADILRGERMTRTAIALGTLRRRIDLLTRLPGLDVWLLASACTREIMVRSLLNVVPARVLLRFVLWRAAHAPPHRRRCSAQPNRVLWAVRVAGRRVPASTCLTQALTAQWMLAHYGFASDLRLGVALSQAAGFQAHAWVEMDGLPVLGGAQSGLYVPLPDLKSTVL